MEQRREHKLTPYQTEDGKWVRDHLAWEGSCSGCNQKLFLTIGIDRPAAALLWGNGTNVAESSYDDHACKAQPYRINRPLTERDMAHPIKDAHFIPDIPSQLFDRVVGKI